MKDSNKSVRKQLLTTLAVILLLGIGYAVYWWNVVFPREFAEGYFGEPREYRTERNNRRDVYADAASDYVDSIYRKETLLNDYSLQYRATDSLLELYLVKGEQRKVLSDISRSLPECNVGRLYLDAEDFFVIEQVFGSCIQHYNVYKKDTSATLLAQGEFFLYSAKDKQTLIFLDADVLKIYDHKLRHVESYTLPADNPCICPACWKIASLSDNSIGITYKDQSDKERNITIKRKY